MLNTTETNKPISELKPWLKHFPRESLTVHMPYRTIYETFNRVCTEHPSAKALYYYGTRMTYAALLRKVDTLANCFWGMGVREGDMVSFLMPTTPESICSMYALNKIGAVPNFIDPRMDVGRILSAAKGVHSKLFVTIDLAFPKVKEIMEALEAEKIIVASAADSLLPPAKLLWRIKAKCGHIPYGGNVMRWSELAAFGHGVNAPQVPFRDGSLAAITYTGGTTGTPKGVMLTNDGLNTMADSFVLSGAVRGENDRFLEIMPIFASYGVGCGVHMPLAMGFELIVIPKFTPDQLGRLIRKYRPNHMMGVPSFYEQLMHSKDLWDVDLSFLLTTGCGGDTMNPGLEERFNRFLREHRGKYPLSQGYGMSEMSGAATCCFGNIYKDNSSGIPLLVSTVGIFDPDSGEELGFGQEGEICMTGRNMMAGYYHNPDETANVMRRHADGKLWIHSGDIGYIDEDGFVFIKGRIKQIIIRFDGHKVFPVSIEGVINRHRAVGECAVVGIPDPDHAQGEVPLGIVELKSTLTEQVDTQALRRELLAMCDELCEERGKPADIVFIPKMLYTGLNKHDYRRLRELYREHIPQTR
ncbi:MAG: acyl--CoA ligase [Clostridia bacterium]|nr:acyl--CoA ligase [Clostridia bacterium]